jgi:hypothetical protein
MSNNTTASASVSQAMTADQAANAIKSMLSGDGEQQEPEALMGDEPETIDEEVSAEDDAAEVESEDVESEDAEEPEQEEQPSKFTVKVDGKDVEVSLDELQKGYSRTEDYTRKTQALAQERKQAQAEFESVRNERAQYAQLLGALQEQLTQATPQVDMDYLYNEDPIEWVKQRELQRSNAERMAAIASEQQRLSAEQAKEQNTYLKDQLSKEKDLLLSQAPELKDPKTAAKAKQDWIAAGKAVGLSEQELNNVRDHRILLALRKLAAYDSMVAKRKDLKPVQSSTPTARPGTISKQPQSSIVKQSQQRLAKTGNVRDAASLIERLL